MKKTLSICSVVGLALLLTFTLTARKEAKAASNFSFTGIGGTYGSTTIALSNSVTTLIGQSAYTWILPGDSRYSTSAVAGATSPLIACKQGQGVSFWIQAGSSNTTSSAYSVVFVTSPDGTHWDTASPFVLSLAPTAAQTDQVMTNWNVLGYITPWYITNASANSGGAHGYATNLSIYYALPGF